MQSMMDLCFMCLKDYHCVFMDDRKMSQLEYLLPEIAITRLRIPLQICSLCEGCLNAFSRFKQRSINSFFQLEARIKETQNCEVMYINSSLTDNIDTSIPGQQTENSQEVLTIETHLNIDGADNMDERTTLMAQPSNLNDICTAESELTGIEEQLPEIINTQTNIDETLSIPKNPKELLEYHTQDISTNNIKLEQLQMALPDNQYIDGAEVDNYFLTYETQPENLQESTENQENNYIHDDDICIENVDDNKILNITFENLDISIKEEINGTLQDKIFYDDLLQNILNEVNDTNKNTTIATNNCKDSKKISDTKKFKHVEKNLKCNICDKKFSGTLNLRQHLKKHSKQKEFQCPICNKLLTYHSGLYNHMKLHTQKTHKCDICNIFFTSIYELNKHTKRHKEIMDQENKNEIECNFCKKLFSNKYNLKRHMDIHNGVAVQKTCECEICHKWFSYTHTLAIHMKRVHKKTVNYPCYLCNELFLHKRTLNKHLKTHTVTDDYECNICFKLFGFEMNFNEHMKTHSEVKYIK